MDVINEEIQNDVRSALAGDARIPYVREIAVEADGDTVVLRGTVGNFGERHAAVADAPHARLRLRRDPCAPPRPRQA